MVTDQPISPLSGENRIELASSNSIGFNNPHQTHPTLSSKILKIALNESNNHKGTAL
jgi:hypothetical protein